MKLFKKKVKAQSFEEFKKEIQTPKKEKVINPKKLYKDELKKMPKKRRKKALKLLKEYEMGLVLVADKTTDNRARIVELRSKN